MTVKNPEALKSISINQEVPQNINLYTRRGKCETTLELVEYTSTVRHTKFKYKINASYPYTLTGEPNNYVSIDFSEGPSIYVGGCASKMKVLSINPPFITCEKIY